MPSNVENIAIINDTLSMIKKDAALTEAVQKSIKSQEYHFGDVAKPEPRFDVDGKLVVSKSSSFDAARKYGGKVAVLNFASATNPGGGVLNGSNAQEECLCRCSTLLECLSIPEAMDKFYTPHRNGLSPLHNDDIIYTPDVVVFKSDAYNRLFQNKVVDVITCAAPNLREKPGNRYNMELLKTKVEIDDESLYKLHVQRARQIFNIAAQHEADTIILGAFGCGAFRNDPKVVARAYFDVSKEYRKHFKNIEFAVFCGRESTNYEVFTDKFSEA